MPPPARDLPGHAWEAVEQELGFGLPGDYKAIVDTYGPGCFGAFIHLYQPNASLPAINLQQQLRDAIWALQELKRGGERMPYDPRHELVPVGRTDNGDVFYWIRRSATDPDRWPVAVNESRGETWVELEGGLARFLADVLSGARRIPMFPRSFPPDHPTFDPY